MAVAEAKAKVAAAEEGRTAGAVGYTRIAAPFPGVVTARRVDVGHFLQPNVRNEPLFVVTQMDPVRRVRGRAGGGRGVRPADGAKAEVRVQALQGREFPGDVTRTAWALDSSDPDLRTAIDLPNPKRALYDRACTLTPSLTVTLPEAWTLPTAAVVGQRETAHALFGARRQGSEGGRANWTH